MTATLTTPPDNARNDSSTPPIRVASVWSRLWTWIQFAACLLLTAGVLGYLLWTPHTSADSPLDSRRSPAEETVRLAGPKRIHVKPGSPLAQKLEGAVVQPVSITAPMLTVTGTILASLRPGNGKGSDYWQFNSSELLTAFTDWQKAKADIAYGQTQLTAVKELAETRASAQRALVDRMKKLVEAGTDTQMDLAAAQAELIQAEIQGRKEIHEAETAVRLAERTEAALARQLQQAGLEPDLLLAGIADLDIVIADVPEGLMSRVKLGHGCEARFFGLPDRSFSGKVRAIAPVLSRERRSLRVLFEIADPQDLLRPGMFAEIGLGTDPREALMISAEGVVHVGRADYVLVGTGVGDWRVIEVQVGELREAMVEVLSGLQTGDRVAGRGVILLKPYIVQALQARGTPAGGPT